MYLKDLPLLRFPSLFILTANFIFYDETFASCSQVIHLCCITLVSVHYITSLNLQAENIIQRPTAYILRNKRKLNGVKPNH